MSRRVHYKAKPFIVENVSAVLLVQNYLHNEEWRHISYGAGFMQDDPCVYCGRLAHTWDHVEALSKRGHNNSTNVGRACRMCNKQKKAMSVLQFLSWRANGSNLDSILRLRRRARRAERKACMASGVNPAVRDLHRGILKHLGRLLVAKKVLENEP